jgi:signal transduction histidine kinase
VEVRAVVGAGVAHIEVRDEGPGIPPADRARVFERFTRGERAGGGGTGLGLAIARWVVELHGGSIAVVAPETPALLADPVSVGAEGVSPVAGAVSPDADREGCRIRVTLPA